MFGSEWNGVGGLLGIFGIFGKAKHEIKGSIENEEKRIQSVNSGRKTYFDRHGMERSTRTKNKVWHTHDKEGYSITIDSKTKEVLEDGNRHIFEEKKEYEKARAKRAGSYVYSYPIMKLSEYNAPVKVTEYRRVSDDKIVFSDRGYVTPRFRLHCTGKDEYNISYNRKAIYEYCYRWYVDNNMNGAHPSEIKKEAKEYGVTIFDEDIKYCLDRIDMALKDDSIVAFDSLFFANDEYRHAEWVDKKYWF